MRAAIFHETGEITYGMMPVPKIEPAGDIIRETCSAAVRGSALQIDGPVPRKQPMIMGREYMGVVEEAGAQGKNVNKEDRVPGPFPTGCRHRVFCLHGTSPACEHSNYKDFKNGRGFDGPERCCTVWLNI